MLAESDPPSKLFKMIVERGLRERIALRRSMNFLDLAEMRGQMFEWKRKIYFRPFMELDTSNYCGSQLLKGL